ncbi:MAG TPA: nitroreductase family deazaflavin-dependent oxidoreductase [Rugosimonospora sp.]|nr:nitroreductase family deazaflavin-dependent oxidoreductase [Rugosimonospora sp.]
MPTPPAPWLKRLYAAPNAVYRLGLGRLLGRRFLQLTHTGRRTGAPHRVVLEVLRYDAATGEAVVVAGYGRRADWYRNVRAGGPAWVDFGRGRRPAAVRELAPDEAADLLVGYERRYGVLRPLLRRVLSAFAGFDYRGTDDDRRHVAEALPMIAFTPRR